MKKEDKRYRFLNNPRVAKQLTEELDGDESAPFLKVKRLTKSEYDALPVKDENTLYLFDEEETT